jgi:hypothetical protein
VSEYFLFDGNKIEKIRVPEERPTTILCYVCNTLYVYSIITVLFLEHKLHVWTRTFLTVVENSRLWFVHYNLFR